MRGSKVKQIRRDCLFTIGDSRIKSYEDVVVKRTKFRTGSINPDGSIVLDKQGEPETAIWPSVTRFLSKNCPRKIYKIMKKGVKREHVSKHNKSVSTHKQETSNRSTVPASTKAVESESFPDTNTES
jgi:hypothetical protein